MDAPETLRERDARPDDHAEFARLFLELGVHDPVPTPERFERELMPSMLVLEPREGGDGRLAAYAWLRTVGDEAYVVNVVVCPSWRGRRVGRVVMDALARRARAAGCARWRLNVKAGNVPAIRLYESVGLATVYATTAVRLAWDRVDALPSDRVGAVARPLRADEAEATERAFDLFPASLSRAIAADNLHVVAVVVRGPDGVERIEGVSRFDPAFPGAWPFRVRDASLARVLLEGLRAHRLPEPAWLQLSADDAPELASALRAAGAEVVHELLHMRGDVPT